MAWPKALTPEQLEKRNAKIRQFYAARDKYRCASVDGETKEEIIQRVMQGDSMLSISIDLMIPNATLQNWYKIDEDIAAAAAIAKLKNEKTLLSHLHKQSKAGKTEATKFALKSIHKYRDSDKDEDSKEVNITISKEQADLLDE